MKCTLANKISIYLSIYLKSRTERPRKTKVGTEVAHVTRDSDTTFKITRPLYSARPWRVRQLQQSALERIRRGKVLLRCVCSAALAGGGGEGRGVLCRHAHSLFISRLMILFLQTLAVLTRGPHALKTLSVIPHSSQYRPCVEQ